MTCFITLKENQTLVKTTHDNNSTIVVTIATTTSEDSHIIQENHVKMNHAVARRTSASRRRVPHLADDTHQKTQ